MISPTVERQQRAICRLQNAQLERIADRLDDIGKDMSAVNLLDE